MAIQSDHEFAPTQIARAVFPTAFRGYDQDAVRRYLSRLASALEHQQEYAGLGELEARTPAHERVEELEAEVENLRDEIKDLELELVQHSVNGDADGESTTTPAEEPGAFDEHRAIELLGQETARVLESARSAAADILKRAETQAASLKAQAKSELSEARKRSETLVSERQAETHELVERLTADAESNAERITAEADEHRSAVLEESSKILSDAEALAESEQADAEVRAKQIVADAETLRQQVISELVVERRQAQGEMDRMTSARDRLAMSLAVARSELDEVADALVDVSTVQLHSDVSTVSPAADRTAVDATADSPVIADAEDDGPTKDVEAATAADVIDLTGDSSDAGRPDRDKTEPVVDEQPPAGTGSNGGRSTKKGSGGTKAGRGTRTASRKAAKKGTKQARDTVMIKPKADSAVIVVDVDPKNEQQVESLDSDGPAVIEDDVVAESDTASDDQVQPADAETADATTDATSAAKLDSDAGGEVEVDVIQVGSAIDTIEADLAAPATPDGVEFNEPPADGSALSLVEGFTTIELSDLDDSGGTEDDSSIDAEADPGDGVAANQAAQDHPVGDEERDSTDATEADGDSPELVYSVLVNEPQTPEEVITTVASRTASAQPDRTRGDLLFDEPFTGRLSKEFAARDRALTRSGPNFRRQLRRALNDDQSEVLDLLRAGRGEIKIDELPAFGDQIDRYLAPLRRGLSEIAQAGAKAGGQNNLSQTALDNLVRQLARYIVDKVRIPTIQVLQETPDHDRERILEPIRALYRDFRNVGLPDLTEDALYEAFAIGLYDSIEPAAPIRWVVDPRSDPDPVCEINRGRDDVVKGETFPSGHARPLSLPGCRCLVTVADY